MKIQGPGLKKAVRIISNCRVQVRGKPRQLSENQKPRLWKITRAIDKSKAQAYGKSREPSGEFPCEPDGAKAPGHSCVLHCVLVGVDRLNPLVIGYSWEPMGNAIWFRSLPYGVSNGVMLGFSYEFCLSSLGFQMQALWGSHQFCILHACRTGILLCDS